MAFVVPAVLPASKKDLEEKLALLSVLPGVSRIQIDVVDGRFAAPASWPYNSENWKLEIENWREMLPDAGRIEYEIDLMCLDVEEAAVAWLALGATRLTLHAESALNLPGLLTSLRESLGEASGVSLGLAIDLASSFALIEPYADNVEYVQCMGIARIGRQGEPFDRRVLEKIRILRERHPDLPVQVDGGVSIRNAESLVALGVSNLVVGSGILKASDPAQAIAELEELYLEKNPYGV